MSQKTMKALRNVEKGKFVIETVPVPTPKPGQVLVKLQACALNRRDLWIYDGLYPAIQPSILGSDGCGVVVQTTTPETASWMNANVLLNPNRDWGTDPKKPSPKFNILGMPSDGTFAEYVAIDADRLIRTPEHLVSKPAVAAALPLAGLTAFRALFTQAGLPKSGATQRVLVTGAGGGVATFAVQFALAAGASVYVTSGDDAKIKKCVELGCKGGVNYRNAKWAEDLKAMLNDELFDIIVDSAGGDTFSQCTRLLGWCGCLVFFGATTGLPKDIDLWGLFWKQCRIQGTTMSNDIEFGEMVEFVSKHKLSPLVHSVRPFDKIMDALFQMRDDKSAFGKLVCTFD